jgi:DNA-binding Lrp family transcriptional regulator
MNEAAYDPTDIRILTALQQEIPLVKRPFEALAEQLGIPENSLLKRLERLQNDGIIRGISPVIDSRSLGLSAATLVAMPVPEKRIREVADIISSYPEVSHNFRREHQYTLWFTLSAADGKVLDRALDDILSRTGFSRDDILNLPTVRKVKIDVRFPLQPEGEGA